MEAAKNYLFSLWRNFSLFLLIVHLQYLESRYPWGSDNNSAGSGENVVQVHTVQKVQYLQYDFFELLWSFFLSCWQDKKTNLLALFVFWSPGGTFCLSSLKFKKSLKFYEVLEIANLHFLTSAFQPVLYNPYFPTRTFQPVLSIPYFPSRTFQPVLSNRYFTICTFQLVLYNPYFPTRMWATAF